ncbi:FAD-dependent oxidoreductase [bacterium]|nr:FAD-dependent oxidoreductase [bacterium]
MGTKIIGSGIAGISAGYHLNQQGDEVEIFEQDSDWGGLCANFTINGFRFDKFVHFTFANDEYIKNIFENSSPTHSHPSISYNFYKGYWLKHPAQNNLAQLPLAEKIKIILDFAKRKNIPFEKLENYEQWLLVQYGKYFSENFPMIYTKKYWGLEANELETKWIGKRMHSPSLKEVIKGAIKTQEENFYYTNYMKYPKVGGFRSILNDCRKNLDIKFNKKVIKINPIDKILYFSDDTTSNYDNLISTIPLPKIAKIIDNCPENVKEAANNLHHTSGYMVSLGFNRADIAKHLWFYIYDKDILASRVYSPSLKSKDNVPNGCSSLQAEIFFDNKDEMPDKETVLKNTVEKLSQICNFSEEEIIVKDIRFEKYANVTFDKNIYQNRQIVLDYLKEININSIGRFGKWEYMWTHQAFQDGINIAKAILK